MFTGLTARPRFERPFLAVGILLAALLGSGFIWLWPALPQHAEVKREFPITMGMPEGPACFGGDDEEFDQWVEARGVSETLTKGAG